VRARTYKKPEPKCCCEFVDIGVGMQKVHEDPGCPACVEIHEPGLEGVEKILFAGDTHGEEDHVRYLLQMAVKENAQAVFVLGDFGIWDHMDGGAFTSSVSKFSKQYEVPVYFLPGNHENYDLLFEYEAEKPRCGDGFVWLKPGVGYSPRGHRWAWNGVRFMSLGGAYSVDKQWRLMDNERAVRQAEMKRDRESKLTARERYVLRTGQWTWWYQEEISQEELDHALRPGEVDVLLTHDKPRAASPGWNRKDIEECWENQEAIQEVVDAKTPRLLLHGHLHYAYDQRLANGTYVKAFDCDPEASRHSGGSGEKTGSWGLLELDHRPDGLHQHLRLTWAGKTFEGWSSGIEKTFELDSEDKE
jgi:Icc-related predicted phosphoesterase